MLKNLYQFQLWRPRNRKIRVYTTNIVSNEMISVIENIIPLLEGLNYSNSSCYGQI